MARRTIKRRQTQKRRRTRQKGGGCHPSTDCNDCQTGDIENLCRNMQKAYANRGPYQGTRSKGAPRSGGKSRRRRIKRKGTKRRKP